MRHITYIVTFPSRSHLDSSLRIFGARPIFRHERCRALFKRSLALTQVGLLQDAHTDRQESIRLYRELYPRAVKAPESLTESDFDEIVAFWSR